MNYAHLKYKIEEFFTDNSEMTQSEFEEIWRSVILDPTIGDWTEQNKVVDQFYQMNPETERITLASLPLREGMFVLIGDPKFRAPTDKLALCYESGKDDALLMNRWFTIEDINKSPEFVTIIAAYEDRTKRQIRVPIHCPWLVKNWSFPTEESKVETRSLSDW